MSSKLPIVAILPAFNEADSIGSVVRACREFVEEVVVVDDGSADETGRAASESGAEVARHSENQGKGAAIRTAFEVFQKKNLPWLVLLDSDGQHDPAEIPALHRLAQERGFDLVLGDRMTDTKKMPLIRIATNRFMSWVISKMSGQFIPDTQCGFRLFSRKLVGTLNLTTSHFDLESEMLIQAARAGFTIGSCRIKTIYEGESSHIHPIVDTIRFIKLVWRYLGAR